MKMTTEPGFTWIPQSEINRRIETIPLPKKLKDQFLRKFNLWISCSGTEWAVGRVKAYKDYVLGSYAAGDKLPAPSWFATTASGNLSGVLGTLLRLALCNKATLQAVMNLLGVASAVHRDRLTTTVAAEISAEVQQSPVLHSLPKRGLISQGRIYSAMKSLGWRDGVKTPPPVPILQALPGKHNHACRVLDDLTSIKGTPIWQDHKKILERALGAEVAEFNERKFSSKVGEVHCSHEPGLKTRYFASPNVVIQRALEPLKRGLLQHLVKVPWDCTLNQRKADDVIKTALQHNRTVHSVDLSKATDNFPWSFQKVVLGTLCRNMGWTRKATSLLNDTVESGVWTFRRPIEISEGITEESEFPLFWRKGQPLGTGPSFPLFTLSHGILLYILNGNKWNQDFYVLGDDVIILQDGLHRKYRKVLAEWEVSVSELKSFSSSRLAQFAGVTYTREGSFWTPKWRKITTDTILDLQAWWYPGLTRGMRDDALIRKILALPEPYGKGRNPDGVPLDERFPPAMVEMLLVEEGNKALEARPSATVVSTHALFGLLREKHGEHALNFWFMGLNPQPEWVANRVSTETLQHALPPSLVDGTDVAGYPRRRLSPESVDPYSVGTLRQWKRRYRQLSPEDPV